MKIVLHAGAPKTGTSSLQYFLHAQREALLERGVLYPRSGIAARGEPKHQWMVDQLMRPAADQFAPLFESAVSEARDDTHTVLLSSEGLFNHWWDFSPAGRAALKALKERYPVEAWVFFRDPIAFIRSDYIEKLKAPKWRIACYGRDLSINHMLDDPWFARHLDYIGFVRDVETVLGAGAVRPFPHTGDTIGAVLGALGVDDLTADAQRRNRTMGAFGVAVLRRLNRLELSPGRKRKAVELIMRLDGLAGGESRPLILDGKTRKRVLALAAESIAALRADYGLNFDLVRGADGAPQPRSVARRRR
ncbi:MAG TPA: hypothetical protein VGS12_00785 [Caulobacteraceae bacterium]|nr:hypothetical protein [Caulobacteraceae bacterium]